jgi:ribonucleoside-diphosphate reductase alpha chain
MTLTLIKKRSGSVVTFTSDRILTAIKRAYEANSTPIDATELDNLTNQVVHELDYRYSTDEIDGEFIIPSVEDVQDVVERVIAQKGDFEVAKAYILYRQERAEVRYQKQQEMLDKVNQSATSVKKRSGKIVPFDVAQIELAIKNIASSFPEGLLPVDKIVAATKLNIYDGITTSEITKAIILALKPFVERDPIFSNVSARFLVNDLYKEVLGTDEYSDHFKMMHERKFAEMIKRGIAENRYDARLVFFDLNALAKAMDPKRDQLFEFMGLQVLYDRYFVRTEKKAFLETPQYFWMRVAMGMSILEKDPTKTAIEFYNTLSRMLYVPSTPTLLHSGTAHPQMSSCFLSTTNDDLAHIFKVIGDNAQLSKYSGGVANDWTDIRATNAWIKTINTGSQGVIPFLKIVDATTASINRSGKRRGATVVYLETWHMDIEEFLDLRKNTGDERRRTHDTNTANWIPDLFMKRVADNEEWTLFSPEEVPDLHHIYGKKFEEAYIAYEQKADKGEINMFKRVKAADLWRKMLMMIFETGHPWITFKDPSNIRSPQDHVGVVHGSNLCTEITLNTSATETAVCNIGSLNLPRHLKGNEIDFALMETTIKTAMQMLDNVIDISFYPIPEAKHSNMKHRPVGLGIMGTQDVFYAMGLNFDSDAAVQFSDKLMEFVSWHAIYNSAMIAKVKGAYETFKGSKWDRGLFPVDTIKLLEEERGIETGILPTATMDWAPVREAVKQYGMRNSNTMAIAPTATIANISGALPSVEPIYKNLYVKSNFSGEFTCVNDALVIELRTLGLWNDTMLEKIKQLDGNIESIIEIPETLRNKYKEAFQIDPHWVIMHAAVRGKWIDQSQSINLFLKTSSGRVISDTYMHAWKMGLKTTYYLRTLGATSVEKTTVDIKSQTTLTDTQTKVTAPVRPTIVMAGEVCESCQ